MDQRFLEPRIGKIQKRGQRFRTGDGTDGAERKTSDEMIIEMAQSAAEPPQTDVSIKNSAPEAEPEMEPEAETEIEPEAETEPEDEAYEDEREYFEE